MTYLMISCNVEKCSHRRAVHITRSVARRSPALLILLSIGLTPGWRFLAVMQSAGGWVG